MYDQVAIGRVNDGEDSHTHVTKVNSTRFPLLKRLVGLVEASLSPFGIIIWVKDKHYWLVLERRQ